MSGGEGAGLPIVLRITSEPARLSSVRSAVEQFASRLGFGSKEVGNIVLAVDEAVCNVIRHGYEGRPGQPIEIRLERVDGESPSLQITISDRAPQVDPARLVGRDLAQIRPGGLGIHIMKTVMDEVEYTRRSGDGMQLRMVKRLVPEGQHETETCGPISEASDGQQ